MASILPRVGLSIKRLQMRHHRAVNAELAGLGVTIVQRDALRHLHESPGASLHDLAQLTFQSDQAFGTLAGRLIDRGLIERVPGPGRAVRHRLTLEGDRLREEASGVVERVLSDSFERLTPAQVETLDALLQQLVGAPEG